MGSLGDLGIVWVLGTDGSISLQGLTLSLAVDCLHPEEVEAALIETFNIKFTDFAFGFSAGQPNTLFGIHLFNCVVLDWISSIILGWPPVQVARVGSDVGNLKGSKWGAGDADHKNLNLCLIRSLVVL